MMITLMQQHELIAKASAMGWEAFRSQLIKEASNDLVKADWSVKYDELGHGIIIEARIGVVHAKDVLLQVWLKDEHPGIWIPEYRPWVASVVEFKPEQAIKESHVGLFDSKWRAEDVGETYHALLWGYLDHEGVISSFAFQKEFKYPG